MQTSPHDQPLKTPFFGESSKNQAFRSMQPEIHKLLLDIEFALLEIQEFTAGMNHSTYHADSKSKAALERKFEIIGEACSRIRNDFPEEFEKIRNGHQIIGFRNRLIHGYDSVDDAIVWDVLQTKLPDLLRGVEELLSIGG
jgi:uncharacterized protein with HEPN domain